MTIPTSTLAMYFIIFCVKVLFENLLKSEKLATDSSLSFQHLASHTDDVASSLANTTQPSLWSRTCFTVHLYMIKKEKQPGSEVGLQFYFFSVLDKYIFCSYILSPFLQVHNTPERASGKGKDLPMKF